MRCLFCANPGVQKHGPEWMVILTRSSTKPSISATEGLPTCPSADTWSFEGAGKRMTSRELAAKIERVSEVSPHPLL
jgi:hypothetical protein